MNKKTILTLIALNIFLVGTIFSQDSTNKINVKDLTDHEILKYLNSTNPSEAKESAKEIFFRGERMIPHLIKLRGNNTCFYGLSALGRWGSGETRPFPPCNNNEYKVTVEIASLFLIYAIFREDLQFAAPPYLYEENCKENGNTPERVKRAWKAATDWYVLLEKDGINSLRNEGQGPLMNSGIRFY